MKNYETNNVIANKTYEFALQILKTIRIIAKKDKEFILTKQIIRSGTSIGANVEEALGAGSKKDFLYKISIAYREARETKYWLKLLHDSSLLDDKSFNNLYSKIEEILKIIGKIQITTKKSLTQKRNL